MPDPIFRTRSRARIASDNREEIDGWIDERAAALVAAGIATDEAARRARAEFGDAESAERYAVNEDVAADRRERVAQWVEEIRSDVRVALRGLRRTPIVAIVVLLTFAIGIGATTTVYSVVYAMLVRPLPFGNASALANCGRPPGFAGEAAAV